MSSKASAERLARSLEYTGLVEIVNSAHLENQVRVLCRVLPGKEPPWLNVVNKILELTEMEQGKPHSWQAHICKFYMRKEQKDGSKNLVYGWNVSIQAPIMESSLEYVGRVIRGEEPSAIAVAKDGEVMEMEFTGMSGERKPGPRGKGAYTISGGQDFRVTK